MNEKFQIPREELKDEKFQKFAKEYQEEINYLTNVIMMIEPDKMFIKSNMKKLLYYVHKNNKEKNLK